MRSSSSSGVNNIISSKQISSSIPSSGVNNIISSKQISSSIPSKSSYTWTTTPSTSSPIPTTTRKSIEEVWEDITDSSLHHHPTTAYPAFLQDFLARAFNKDPPTRDDYSPHQSSAGGGFAAVMGSRGLPRPTTALSLNSGPEFHDPKSTDHLIMENPHGSVGIPSFWSPLNSLSSSAAVFSSFSKKRPPENNDNPRDRKDLRLIKNRDSANRSRARKQAYIYELEQEVARLGEENAKLRKRLLKEDIYKRSCLAAPTQLPKKKSLCRSLTAPF